MVCVASCNESMTNPYMIVPYPSQQVLNFCVPTTAAIQAIAANTVSSSFSSTASQFTRVMGDLNVCWPVLAGCGAGAILVALLYVFLLQCMAGLLVWGAICITIVMGAAMAFFMVQTGTNPSSVSSLGGSTNALVLTYAGYTLGALVFLFCCAIIFLRQRINIAVQVSKEAASAVMEMPGMQLYPFLPFLCLMIYAGYWIVLSIYMASVMVKSSVPLESMLSPLPGRPSLNNPRIQYAFNDTYQYMFAYHFFHLLWNIEFLIYFSYLVMSGSVADWYFTAWNEDSRKLRGSEPGQLTNWPVVSSFFRSMKHIGSICFASFIIAVIQFIRAMILYIEEKTKNIDENNVVLKYMRACVFCCLSCFFKCLECCMDKINKNGLIMMAIRGESFCSSTCSAFRLVWNNLARVAAVSVVGSILISVGQVVVALGCAAICGAVLTYMAPYSTTVTSILLPCMITFIVAYFVASLFLSIFDAAIDTIFICFLLDEDRNGNSGQMLASQNLQDIINAYAADSKEMADKRKTPIVKADE